MASDNETAEMWREWRRQRAAKRAVNRYAAALLLVMLVAGVLA